MRVVIFELSESALGIERHGISVDRMHDHDFESGMREAFAIWLSAAQALPTPLVQSGAFRP